MPVKIAAGRHVVDPFAGRQFVGAIGDARVVREQHQVPGVTAECLHHREDRLRLGQVQAFVLCDARGRYLEFARHDAGGRKGAHRRAGEDQVRPELAFAQASRHLRCVLLAASIEDAVPVLLSGQAEVGLGMAHEREPAHAVGRRAGRLDGLQLALAGPCRGSFACDLHDAIDHAGRITAHRLVRGGRKRLAGAQAEARAVTRADDLVILDLAAGQPAAVVRAEVVDGKELARRCCRRRRRRHRLPPRRSRPVPDVRGGRDAGPVRHDTAFMLSRSTLAIGRPSRNPIRRDAVKPIAGGSGRGVHAAHSPANRFRLKQPGDRRSLAHLSDYIMPVCSRAASDIIDWSQGGSKTSFTSTSLTVGIDPDLVARLRRPVRRPCRNRARSASSCTATLAAVAVGSRRTRTPGPARRC